MSNSKELINVYFDYTCPWVRQAGYWLIHLEESDLVEITWKPYLLEQQNSDNNEDWFAWEQDLSTKTPRGPRARFGTSSFSLDEKQNYVKIVTSPPPERT